MTDDLNHRCRSDQTCVARTPDGAAITMAPDTLCHGCVRILQDRLTQLPIIREVLRLYLVRGGASAQTKVAFSSEPAPPLNVHTLDLIDEIDDIIDRTGGLPVADLINQPTQEFVIWPGGKPRRMQKDGVDRAMDIARAWKRADDVIGMSPKWQRRFAKCPDCGLQCLGSFEGSSTIQCSNCGSTMTRDEYEGMTLVQSESSKPKGDQ